MNFFSALWLRWQGLKPLIAEDLPMAPTPMKPAGEAREPVNDVDGEQQRVGMHVQRAAMDRLCLQANAYVYRDYGRGAVVERSTHVRPLSTDESALLEKIDVVAQ